VARRSKQARAILRFVGKAGEFYLYLFFLWVSPDFAYKYLAILNTIPGKNIRAYFASAITKKKVLKH